MRIDKVYVINLEKREDRMKKMEKLLRRLGNKFEEYERREAVDGSKISEEERKSILTLKSRILYKSPLSFKDIKSAGAIGCYKSHTSVWDESLRRGYKNIIVLEDDIETRVKEEEIEEYIKSIPEDYDICYLDYYGLYGYEKNIEYNERWIYNREDEISYFSAYIISDRGMRRLLEGAYPIEQQIDCYASAYANENKEFRRYLSKEIIFSQGYNPIIDTDITRNTLRCYINDIILTRRFMRIVIRMVILSMILYKIII